MTSEQEREVESRVAQRCAPLVEALARLVDLEEEGGPDVFSDPYWVAAMERARDALAAHRAQEKAGGAEADQ